MNLKDFDMDYHHMEVFYFVTSFKQLDVQKYVTVNLYIYSRNVPKTYPIKLEKD